MLRCVLEPKRLPLLYVRSFVFRVYLDNCVYNRPFDDQDQSRIRDQTKAVLYLRELIESGELDLVWSYVVDIELARNPFAVRREGIELWKRLAAVELAPSIEIVSVAIDLRAIGLRDIDSLHVACAIRSGSAYFITTDDAILRKSAAVSELRIIDPIAFLEELREYEKRS